MLPTDHSPNQEAVSAVYELPTSHRGGRYVLACRRARRRSRRRGQGIDFWQYLAALKNKEKESSGENDSGNSVDNVTDCAKKGASDDMSTAKVTSVKEVEEKRTKEEVLPYNESDKETIKPSVRDKQVSPAVSEAMVQEPEPN